MTEAGRTQKSAGSLVPLQARSYDRVHFVDSKKSARSYDGRHTITHHRLDVSVCFIEELQGDVSDERDFPENPDRFF